MPNLSAYTGRPNPPPFEEEIQFLKHVNVQEKTKII
jgi:hypothetical protein